MTPTDNTFEARVISWISESLDIAPGKLSASTRVNLDLGVDGEDGVELIRSFGKAFGVDVSDFPYSRYFGPEASNPFGFFGTALRFLARRNTYLQPLFVTDLVKLVKKGGAESKDQHS